MRLETQMGLKLFLIPLLFSIVVNSSSESSKYFLHVIWFGIFAAAVSVIRPAFKRGLVIRWCRLSMERVQLQILSKVTFFVYSILTAALQSWSASCNWSASSWFPLHSKKAPTSFPLALSIFLLISSQQFSSYQRENFRLQLFLPVGHEIVIIERWVIIAQAKVPRLPGGRFSDPFYTYM